MNDLTVYGTPTAFLIIEKTSLFPSLLPPSITSKIPSNSPVPGSTHGDCETWLQIYNTSIYCNSGIREGLGNNVF